MVFVGRTQDLAFGSTAALTDVSDLYKERLSKDGTQYLLDGRWKDLTVDSYEMKVKGQNETVKFEVKSTHRGPVISADAMNSAQVLFANQIPLSEDKGPYSFAWAGHALADNTFDVMEDVIESADLEEYKQRLRTHKTWSGAPTSMVMADSRGNIGYSLLSASPKRKNGYPYLGCFVQDGTSSDHDWVGIVEIDKLPFVLNPAKGYFVAANNRIMPDNA